MGASRHSWKSANVAVLALILSLALTSCRGTETPSTSTTTATATGASSSTSAQPTERTETITVDWASAGKRWATEWRLGYGPGSQELGIEHFPDQDPIVPSAVAALPDGSFAVVDPGRERVVGVTTDGVVERTIVDVPEIASDIAWDQAHHRLLVIANEPEGEMIEIPTHGAPAAVGMGHAVARLTPTEDGVYEGGPSGYDEFSSLPAPLSDPQTTGPGGIVLDDRSTITFSSNQTGSRWQIARTDRWSLDLKFVGKHGPAPVLSLMSDLLVTGDTLVTAPLVGTFATGVDLSRQLLMIRVDVETGALLGATHLRQCGLAREENVVSRITASADGTIHQFCVGPRGVELRREPPTD